MPEKGPSGCLGTLLVAAAIGGALFYFGTRNDRPSLPFDPSNPETIVNLVTEGDAHPVATFKQGQLDLIYSIDPWALTTGTARSQFYSQAIELVKTAFTAPSVTVFCDSVTVTFKDVYGHENQGRAGQICMNRATAARVNWDGFDSDNFPRIADRIWLHPAFAK
jgi:hypothetical protein